MSMKNWCEKQNTTIAQRKKSLRFQAVSVRTTAGAEFVNECFHKRPFTQIFVHSQTPPSSSGDEHTRTHALLK